MCQATLRIASAKASGLFRDSPADERAAFLARDGNYLSARWPGDVHTFARTFAAMLADVGRKGERQTGSALSLLPLAGEGAAGG